MKHRSELASLLCALALASCSSGAASVSDAAARCAGNRGGHVEVYVPNARVYRVLGERSGRSGVHEGFIIDTDRRTFLVEDNVDITGPIPLHRGDAVSLLGQLECDDNVIHWTHHDPRGRHPAGYVKVNGTTYE